MYLVHLSCCRTLKNQQAVKDMLDQFYILYGNAVHFRSFLIRLAVGIIIATYYGANHMTFCSIKKCTMSRRSTVQGRSNRDDVQLLFVICLL
jgi:hypothetical protein